MGLGLLRFWLRHRCPKRDWFRLANARSGQWQAVGRKFFPRKKASKDQVKRLSSWKLGKTLPMPVPKRVKRTDVRPRPPAGSLACEVCGHVFPSHVALRAHYNKTHAVLDDQLVTTPNLSTAFVVLGSSSPQPPLRDMLV